MLKREDIRIRDPFILVDDGKYYMYGTTALVEGSLSALPATYAYISSDLENFDGPIKVFDGEGFWADRDYWAPEVHKYNGKYYMFISLKSETRRRATQILVCDTPTGAFKPLSDKPATPDEWECLDGTLWVENGTPYIVFCHEWLQIGDGAMCVQQLSQDLKERVGEPVTIFHATDSGIAYNLFDGAIARGREDCYVTDGPFLYKRGSRLNMLWSTHAKSGYVVLNAYSDNGILGEWKHSSEPIFERDGGHAMLFTDLNGETQISLHQPNIAGQERAKFFPFND